MKHNGRNKWERNGAIKFDEQGEEVFENAKKQGCRFWGKARDAHPYDRQSGAGKGTRKPDDKKGGHGRGNWGDKPDQAYKRGQVDDSVPDVAIPTKIVTPAEVAEEAESSKGLKIKVAAAAPVEEEVVVGVDLDDYLKGREVREKVKAREAEGLKGVKVLKVEDLKIEKQSTFERKEAALKVSKKQSGRELLGFSGADDTMESAKTTIRTELRKGIASPMKRGHAKKALKRMSVDDFPPLIEP